MFKKIAIISLVSSILALNSNLALSQEVKEPQQAKPATNVQPSGRMLSIFTSQDENQDHVVTRDEMLANAQERFDAMDKDKDNQITKEEVATHFAEKRKMHSCACPEKK